jgi:hypothetical protein
MKAEGGRMKEKQTVFPSAFILAPSSLPLFDTAAPAGYHAPFSSPDRIFVLLLFISLMISRSFMMSDLLTTS